MANQINNKSNLIYKVSLYISFLIGIVFRIYHLFRIGFQVPFDLGGLFYQFSIEIIKNGFALPMSIPYYLPGGLPFAYPPLPFYIQAFLLKIFEPGNFVITNILPPIFSIISIFLFFLLAKKVISEKIGVIAAVFTFSIIPLAITEQIQAMGLAESVGTCSLILYTFTLLWASDNKKFYRWIFPGIILGLCIMSSPGSFYASILISILFGGISIANSISRKDTRYLLACFVVGIIGLAVSAPYWGTVISNHGIEIYSSTFANQNISIFNYLLENVRNLRILQVSYYWNILFLLGLLLSLLKKNYLLFLFSIILILIPRENWVMSIAASLIIGNGITHLRDLFRSNRKIIKYLKVAVIWLLVLFFIIDSGYTLTLLINNDNYDITAVQLDDLQEIYTSNLIPPDEYVVVIGNWGLIEWSPAIIQRAVINNPFGLEWVDNRSEINILLDEKLLQTSSLEETINIIQDEFNDLERVYIISQKSHLHKLLLSDHDVNASYEALQDFDDLGLGIITF